MHYIFMLSIGGVVKRLIAKPHNNLVPAMIFKITLRLGLQSQ
jgi:hypothetical protein